VLLRGGRTKVIILSRCLTNYGFREGKGGAHFLHTEQGGGHLTFPGSRKMLQGYSGSEIVQRGVKKYRGGPSKKQKSDDGPTPLTSGRKSPFSGVKGGKVHDPQAKARILVALEIRKSKGGYRVREGKLGSRESFTLSGTSATRGGGGRNPLAW